MAPWWLPLLLAIAPFQRGAGCLTPRLPHPDLADPYLAFVYPMERLAGSTEAEGLTYRRIDAAILLALLENGGELPEPLREAAGAARNRLAAVAPEWRRAGLADPKVPGGGGGVALDTFCIVGWLLRDPEMARMAAAALKGDAWLPEGIYDGEERFRRSADECWCVRLLAEVTPESPLPEALLERIARTLQADAAADPAGRGTFYEALHMGMALAQASRSQAPRRALAAGVLARWSALHAGDPASGEATPEWINLAGAFWLDEEGAREVRLTARQRLIRSQQDDGCWRIAGAGPPDYGSSFLTLRALLALAPQAVSPAQ